MVYTRITGKVWKGSSGRWHWQVTGFFGEVIAFGEVRWKADAMALVREKKIIAKKVLTACGASHTTRPAN
jgi:hypothetical protein